MSFLRLVVWKSGKKLLMSMPSTIDYEMPSTIDLCLILDAKSFHVDLANTPCQIRNQRWSNSVALEYFVFKGNFQNFCCLKVTERHPLFMVFDNWIPTDVIYGYRTVLWSTEQKWASSTVHFGFALPGAVVSCVKQSFLHVTPHSLRILLPFFTVHAFLII